MIKEKVNDRVVMKGDILEKRFFRLFIEYFTNLLEIVMVFEAYDEDGDGRISQEEFDKVQKMFEGIMIEEEKYLGIWEMARRGELGLEEFIVWMNEN